MIEKSNSYPMKLIKSSEESIRPPNTTEAPLHRLSITDPPTVYQEPRWRNKSKHQATAPQERLLPKQALIPDVRKKHALHGFQKLPWELVLETAKHCKPKELRNLLLLNKTYAEFGKANMNAIQIGIQKMQYPEYYDLFGTDDRKTPNQEYNSMIEEENREWWVSADDQRFLAWYGFPRRPTDRPFRSGELGRVDLYSALAKDIEEAKTVFCKKDDWLVTQSDKVTTRALLLLWKMQWQDRPGLQHLCERTETEEMYLAIRHRLFEAEGPEVRACFKYILMRVASHVWKKPGFRYNTEDWYQRNEDLIGRQQHISIHDLDCWVRNLAAELVVEAVLKLGILRALRVKPGLNSGWDMLWIHITIANKLEELLDETAATLAFGKPEVVFRFGRNIGLKPGDIVLGPEEVSLFWPPSFERV
ncbi:MAG: hypothetical protein Q9219_007442 [cf. Caloplaca sp. 3 TL-2023]